MAKLLIDGYNLLAETDLPNREALLRKLADYQDERGHEITIIFDGTKGGTLHGDQYLAGKVRVRFTPITVSADDEIEELLEQSNSNQWVVVSSDRRIQSAARQARANFLSSADFVTKLLVH